MLNANELLLDLYIWANTKNNGGKLINEDKTLNEKYLLDDENLLDANKQQFLSSAKKGFDIKILNDFLKSKGDPATYKINKLSHDGSASIKYLERMKNELSKALSNDIPIELSITKGTKMTTFYGDYMREEVLTGAHSVYVTGMNEDGVFVSSWGGRWFISFNDLRTKNCEISFIETKKGWF